MLSGSNFYRLSRQEILQSNWTGESNWRQGAKKFLAIKSKIIIPLENITKVSTEQIKPLWFPERRIGAHVPGVFMAGRFWLRKGGKTFCYAKDFSSCITLTLRNDEYSKVIVEVEKNKELVADRIKASGD